MFTSIPTYCPSVVETRLVLAASPMRGRTHDDMALAGRPTR